MEKTKVMAKANFNNLKTESASQNYRINTSILCFLVLFATTVSAQKSKVMDVFFKYGIDAGVLNPEKTKRSAPEFAGSNLAIVTPSFALVIIVCLKSNA